MLVSGGGSSSGVVAERGNRNQACLVKEMKSKTIHIDLDAGMSCLTMRLWHARMGNSTANAVFERL